MSDDTDVFFGGSDVESVVAALASEGWLAPQSLDRFSELITRFGCFVSTTFGVYDLDLVTPSMASSFVDTPGVDGAPTVAVRHLRRSAIRLCFRKARELGLADGDPTLDLDLPTRKRGSCRPLTEDEVELCRFASVASLEESRLPASWALAEATARTAELHRIAIRDVDLSTGLVRPPGATRVEARPGQLTEWG